MFYLDPGHGGKCFTLLSSPLPDLKHISQATNSCAGVDATPSILRVCFTLWNLCQSCMVLTLSYETSLENHVLLRETKILSKM